MYCNNGCEEQQCLVKPTKEVASELQKKCEYTICTHP